MNVVIWFTTDDTPTTVRWLILAGCVMIGATLVYIKRQHNDDS